jgi:hypothetical protein
MIARVVRRCAVVATLALAACGSDATGTPVGCPTNLIEGVLEPLGMPGSIGIMDGTRHLVIVWTNGYRSAVVDAGVAVLSPSGEVVARAGDTVEVTGGEVRPGEWLACGPPRPRASA